MIDRRRWDVVYKERCVPRKRSDNKPLRFVFRVIGARQYEVAALMGISEETLCRWLRWEMPERQILAILAACEEFAAEHNLERFIVHDTFAAAIEHFGAGTVVDD